MNFTAHYLIAVTLVALVLGGTGAQALRAQVSPGEFGSAQALQESHPELLERIRRIEWRQARLFEALTGAGDVPSETFESEWMLELLGPSGDALVEGEPFSLLGPRAAEVVRWTHAFQREVLAILANPQVSNRSAALATAVDHYRSRPSAALPGVPKDMDVLYDHQYALGFRTGYSNLSGLTWAGHWLRLAATEPLTDLPPGPARDAGVDTVSLRYEAKLSNGEPPQAFPSELPLAPAIAPGLIWLSPESAMIWDNLSMMLEVFADVFASAERANVPRAIDATVDFFLDPETAVTDRDEWEIMALRHGIFFQGGYPLAVMTQNERNMSGHAAHLQGGRMLRSIPGMRR